MEDAIFNRKPLSLGQKVERLRKFRGIKQEYVASKLGVTQQQYSKIEQQTEIEDSLLNQIAEILGVSTESILSFDDEKVTYNINNFYDIHDIEIKDNASNNFVAQIFNPIEKINELYERLLASEREKIEILKSQKS